MIVGFEVSSLYISGPWGAVLFQKIEFVTVGEDDSLLRIPPPPPVDEFPESVQLVIMGEDEA